MNIHILSTQGSRPGLGTVAPPGLKHDFPDSLLLPVAVVRPRPRISGASRHNRTCISGRYYRDTVRSGRFRGKLRRAPPFSDAPAARGYFARGQWKPAGAFAGTFP